MPRHHPVSTTSAGPVISGSRLPRQRVQSSVGPGRHISGSSHQWVPAATSVIFGERLVLTNFDVLIPFLRSVVSNLDCFDTG